MKKLAGKKVLVLGLGASGLALARWCNRHGAAVVVADTRAQPPQLAMLKEELPQVEFICSDLGVALLETSSFDILLKSPGLPPAAVAAVTKAAQARGIACDNELGLFARALDELKQEGYAPQVIGITGTNGKTTVTSLTAKLVECAGKSVAVAGNIGPTLLDTLTQRLADLPDVWVLELSSFQLDGISNFEPSVATILNITQDHLDWHGDMDAYRSAKANIFGGHGLMLLNRDDPAVMALAPVPVRGRPVRSFLTFGVDTPRGPGDYGIETAGGVAWLVRAMESEEPARRRRDEDTEVLIQRLMPLEALRIRGRHNAGNALAALCLASAAGCKLAPMLRGLSDYRGEPHRVESVSVVDGVEYFDDSKGTNVGATVAALQGLGAERKLVIILGGDGKGQDFSPLAAAAASHARAAVLIGRDAPQIRLALTPCGIKLVDASTLPEAVRLAAGEARAGDAVLLSPACASFDMFRDYEHRAQVFCDAVRALGTHVAEGAVL